MSNHKSDNKSRVQTTLLAAIVVVLTIDVGTRLMTSDAATTQSQDQATALPVAYQPENLMSNPADQRRRMIAELQGIDGRLDAIESRLKSRLRVEVTNFPKPAPKED